ncbi:MAG: lipocalin family protein [Chitinophagales bacterium]
MKKIVLILSIVLLVQFAFGQAETFDIATYTPPQGWTKNITHDHISYTTIDNSKGSFCVLAIYTAVASKGDPQKDFASEWNDLVAKLYQTDAHPKTETQTTTDGWKAVVGAAIARQDTINFYAVLTVYSGFGKTISILITLNDQSYMTNADAVLDNISLDKKAVIAKSKIFKPDTRTNNNNGASLVGVWSNSSAAIGNYVTSSGSFVGSADVNTMEEYEFRSDNVYVYRFFGMSSGKLYYTETNGSYKIKGRTLTLTPLTRKGGYSGAIHDEANWLGKPEIFDCYIGANKWEAGPFLNLHKDGNYYSYPDYPYDYYKRIQ